MGDANARPGNGASETFLGAPACRDVTALSARAAVLGVPLASPYRAPGAYGAAAPAALRAAAGALVHGHAHVNFDLGRPAPDAGLLADCGDLALDAADAAGNRVRIRQAVAGVLAAEAVPVVLGGDASVLVPVLQGFEGQGPLTVLQFGAQIGWREQLEGERWGAASAMLRASEMGHVVQIVQAGARGIGTARTRDAAAAREFGAEIVPAERIAREGIGTVVDRIGPGARVFVALSADAFDPAAMPAVRARAPGGLGYWEVLGAIRGVAERARIAGFALVEFVPDHDAHGIGAATAAQLLASTLGLIAGPQSEADAAGG